jgi:hypothetical protein
VASPEANVAHPLFALITNVPTAILSRALGRSEQTAALFLCHAAAAAAVVSFYHILRELNADRWVSLCAACSYMVSASHLICGSIIETYPFASAALMLGIWWTLRSRSLWQIAVVQTLAFGTHILLVAHSLFAAPVLWWTRMGFRRWLGRALTFWALLAAVAAGGFALRSSLYSDTRETARGQYARFMTYERVPHQFQELRSTASHLLAHLVLFNIVAPKPSYSGPPLRMTTFMWNEGQKFPAYTATGWVAATAWALLLFSAAFCNLRQRTDRCSASRGLLLLCSGWIAAVACVFMTFGDDYLLYSALWNGHVLLWVWVGVSAWVARVQRPWASRIGISAFLLVLLGNNAEMVYRMLRNYNPGQLITW